MARFQERQRIRRVLYSTPLLVVLALALVLLARSAYGLWGKQEGERTVLETEQAELASLMAKDASLRERIAALKTDRGMEEAIREKFKVAKEGEGVVVVIDPKDDKNAMVEAENPLMRFFKDLFGF